ncbi:MAG: hypothetical protein D6677_13930 [Calditrichaeota bacterium]|nr:MAG: hypothetical protein D6677_13930 [Calditrichota bacterium]
MKDIELTFYVHAMDRQTNRVLARLIKFCDGHFQKNYKLNLIDLSKNPEIQPPLVLPALVRETPLPRRMAVGDFTNIAKTMLTLNLLTN